MEIGFCICGIVIVGVCIDVDFLIVLFNVEIVVSFGVGYDNVNVLDCSIVNVMVIYMLDVFSVEVVDIVLGLFFMIVCELG